MNKPIGVFDSGVGGLTVLKELTELLPNENFVYFADSANAPYGDKSKTQIVKLSANIIDFLVSLDCKLIVVACNTATAAAVNIMRKKYKLPIIGLEPAVKPACLQTKTKHIGVLATKGTFRGNHFKNTSEKYKDYVEIHLQVAKGLVELAENGIFEGEKVDKLLSKYILPMKNANIDQLVLGCTHYPLFYEAIFAITGNNINIIESGKAVARRTKDVLMINQMINAVQKPQKLSFYASKETKAINNVVIKLFKIGKIKPNVEIIKLI
ncbi:MAG: glutamate racemase [Bacteroidales bacterium]|nr:glutamate racemase [Bacteroidales bacterium]MDD4216463.1 glutamate racemase [Bacteroidales bacterium]MDY0141819.1 glutamate racemase [Bacteroidales bacterium]